MKNKIVCFLTIMIVFLSCKSQLQDKDKFSLFEQEIVNGFYVLKKKEFEQTIEGNSLSDRRYSLKIPENLKSYTSIISTVPNIIEFKYRKKERIIVFGNTNHVIQTKVFGLDKDTFKAKLAQLKIVTSSINKYLEDLEAKKLNGINVQEDHVILYLNVIPRDAVLFEESINSFSYIE